MHKRNISSFMVEILLKIGEFNENCQRPIYCAETIELNLEITILGIAFIWDKDA